MILHEWQGKKHGLGLESLKRFNEYLCDVWENRERYLENEEDENSGPESARRQRFFDFSFDGDITARNYVGVVQFEGHRTTIQPKICRGGTETFNWNHQLLFWLSYCSRIRFPFSFADLSQLDTEDFLEILIYIFAHYTEELLASQPYQAYQVVEEETVYLKGRLMFDAYTKNNLITGKWQHFSCQHQPFVFDNQFNRIIRYVAKRLLLVSKHPPNCEKLNQILYLLDEVSDCACVATDCDRVSLNRLYEDHQHILSLCKMYLSNQMIDTSGDDSDNFCFLVPMEYVFEGFIFGFLQSHFPGHDLRSQSKGHLAYRDHEPVFTIKNDIYIPKKFVLDTKYVLRPMDDGLQAGVGQTHMYQMLAYALRRECAKVILIYPAFSDGETAKACFTIPSILLNGDVQIEAVTIDIITEDIGIAIETMISRLENLLRIA